jgi:hypothetical protein
MPKISELNAITSVANTDLLMVVHDPSGSPSTNKITVGNFANSIARPVGNWTWPLLNGQYTRAVLGGSQNSYIEGQSPGGLVLYNDYQVTLFANNSAWSFDDNNILTIPDTGDIIRDGVSVIGTGQIDGGNAFTTPTAEITVDGGGA